MFRTIFHQVTSTGGLYSGPNEIREQDAELNYSRFMNGLKRAGVEVNRKMLADVAVRDPETFRRFAERAKQALEVSAAGS